MADASIKLTIDLGNQLIEWSWNGSEVEWKQALLTYIGNPVQKSKSEEVASKTTSGFSKIGSAIFHGVERATRPPKKS